jgi:hypothetical protein
MATVTDIGNASTSAPRLGDAGQQLWDDVTGEWDIA